MTTDPSSDVVERWKRLEDAFHDALPNQGEPGDPAAGKALCQFVYDNSETIRATIKHLSAELARKTEALRQVEERCHMETRQGLLAIVTAALSNTAENG